MKIICQNSSESWAGLGTCCWMEVGAQGGVQEGGHQVCTLSQNGALAGSGNLKQLPPPVLLQLCSPLLEWSKSSLRQGQPRSNHHWDPACVQNLNRTNSGALFVSNCILAQHVLSDFRTGRCASGDQLYQRHYLLYSLCCSVAATGFVTYMICNRVDTGNRAFSS